MSRKSEIRPESSVYFSSELSKNLKKKHTHTFKKNEKDYKNVINKEKIDKHFYFIKN